MPCDPRGSHPAIRVLRSSAAAAALLVGVAGCVAFVPRGRDRAQVAPPDDPAERLGAIVEAHNREREARGLPALSVSERLTAAAQGHADDMAGRRRMSHRGGDGSSPFRRIARAGYRYVRAGENVARGQEGVAEVMSDWMTSPGHKRNILGKYSEIGAGYATDADGTPYWCVTFGTPAPSD
jgi:uncharacterized protein YkwD